MGAVRAGPADPRVENAPLAWFRDLAQVAAEVELWAGRPAAAYELVLNALTVLKDTDEDYRAGIPAALGLRALGDLAETQRDERSRQRQRAQLHELLRLTSRHPDDPLSHRSDYDDAWELTERAELGRAEERTDPDQWAQAAGQWDLLGHPLPAAYCRWREAEARLSDGVHVAGIAALRRAYQGALRLGAHRQVAELESLARWYRIDLVADVAPTQEDPLEVYGLTEREREVLAGLAAGRTNQEIADDLFISVKTASVHVSNILRKLGVSGRQDAARVAHRHGIRA